MPYTYDYLRNFTGGENSNSAPDDLLPNQLLVCENVDLSERGGFNRRYGISLHKTIGTHRIDRFFEYEYFNGTSRVLTKFVLTNGEIIDADTLAVLSTGWGSRVSVDVFNNKLYILGNGKYMVYDGTAIADVTCTETDSNLTVIKRCTYLTQRGQRLFAAGDAQNPNLLYFSELGRPEYWKTTSLIKAVTDDADVITGLIEYHGALLAFKTRTIYGWFGYNPETDVEFKQLAVHTGTRAYRTIARVNNTLLYLGEDGVYQLMGTYENVIVSRKISDNISLRIKAIKHSTDPYLDAACAIFDDGKYMLSVPTTDAVNNDTVLVYFDDLYTEGNDPWSIYKGWNISEFLKSFDGNMYSTSSATGAVHKHEEVLNDLGVAIQVHVKLRPVYQEYPVHNKKYRNGYIMMRQFVTINSTVAVTCFVDSREVPVQTVTPDESLTWDLRDWDTAKWDFADLVTAIFTISQKGKRLIIDLADNTLNNAFNVYGFAVQYKVKKPDRR